ncbi:uncharacterized protein [Channa argus]|uniref:uncharacterized protein isoform X2 n=1 Tax=Channa argus TaxID=215402 RepID=UPI003522DAEC
MFLFLISMLQLTAVTGQFSFVSVGDGGDVTLPCKNAKRKCDSTFWLFSNSARNETVPLVLSGRVDETQISERRDRLSLTETCSLLIAGVTVEDVGVYGCRQIRAGKQAGGDVYVHLSVLTVSQRTEGETVTLNCSLSTYGHCRHTVKWLYDGKEVDEDDSLKTSQTDCSDTVTLRKFPDNRTRRADTLKCVVTDDSTGKVQRFPFTPQSSGDTKATSVRSVGSGTNTALLRLIIVSVGLTTLIIIVVVVDVWTRTKVASFFFPGNKRPMDKNTVDSDEDEVEGTVKYENVGDSSASVRLH